MPNSQICQFFDLRLLIAVHLRSGNGGECPNQRARLRVRCGGSTTTGPHRRLRKAYYENYKTRSSRGRANAGPHHYGARGRPNVRPAYLFTTPAYL